jgi:hypothetical protein
MILDPMHPVNRLVHQFAEHLSFRWPVALTRAVWERCVAVPPGVRKRTEVLLADARKRGLPEETLRGG